MTLRGAALSRMIPEVASPDITEDRLEDHVCNSSQLHQRIRAMEIAVQAAELLARPPIIEALSGISNASAISIYREVNAKRAPRGQLPHEPTYYMSRADIHLDSVWLLKVYLLLRHGGTESPFAILKAFKEYRVLRNENVAISFDRFYYLVRHFEAGRVLKLATCSKCDCDYLYRDMELPDENKLCPICNYKPAKK